MHEYYVYILSNRSKTLYTGMTNDLRRRICEHKSGHGSEFTSKYRIRYLVYYESTNDVRVAIEREKQIKGGCERRRSLIESMNPAWRDLSADWFG